MKDRIEIHQVMLVMELLTGDAHNVMEAAKELIGRHKQVEPELLIRVLQNQRYRLWSRIAATYVLGFLEYSPNSGQTAALIRVLANKREQVLLRSHAAEALGNLGAVEATSTLERTLLNQEESKRLQKWCIFALSELHSAQATTVLQRFAQSKPHGVLLRELQMAFSVKK